MAKLPRLRSAVYSSSFALDARDTKGSVLNHRTWGWRGVWPIVLILASASWSAAQPEPRHVLLLHSFEREFAPFDTFAGLFRTELSRQSSTPINFLEVSVRPGRFTDSPEEAPVGGEFPILTG